MLEVAPRLSRRAERLGAIAGADERGTRLLFHLRGAAGVGKGGVGVEVVRGNDLGNLVFIGERIRQVCSSGEMACAALLLRKRLVRDVAHEVLEKAVLAVLRRRWIGLNAQDLLARKRAKKRIELAFGDTAHDCKRMSRKRLADDRRVLQEAALFARQPVES